MTKEQLDATNRHRAEMGLPPIADAAVTETDAPKEEAPQEIKEETQVDTPVDESQDKPAEQDKEALSQTKEETQPQGLTDDAVLAYFKSQGYELASLDEIKTKIAEPSEEDKKRIAEKRDADKLSFGLTNGLFTQKEYEDFVYDSRNPEAMVYDHWAARKLKGNPDLSDSELHEKFREEFLLDYDKQSSEYEDGQEKLSLLRDKLMLQKHGKINELEGKFTSHEAAVKSEKEINKKVAQLTPQFKKDVESAITEASKVTENIGDEKNQSSYTFEYPEEDLKQVKEVLLADDRVKAFIQSGWTKDQVKGLIDQMLWTQNRSKIIAKFAKDHASAELLKHRKESHGIPTHDKEGDIKDTTKKVEYSEAHKEHRAKMGIKD